MFCSNCGAQIDNKAVVCTKCGVPVAGKKGTPSGGNPPISNYMIPAVLTTLFCCVPGGIVSIIYASKANTKLAQGDIAGAQSASKTALGWIIANVAISIVGWMFYILLMIVLGAVAD